MSDRAEQLQMIEDCEARESRLSDWDVNFIDSIGRQLADGRSLTLNQSNALDEIWERVTARG
jgi:hypothetical protein